MCTLMEMKNLISSTQINADRNDILSRNSEVDGINVTAVPLIQGNKLLL